MGMININGEVWETSNDIQKGETFFIYADKTK